MLISIILCSRDPQAASWVVSNLKRTAANPDRLEILVRDNHTYPRGICAVYNEAALDCQGEILVFMHEDAYMMETGWDDVLCQKFAADANLGVLGVAGSCFMGMNPPLWSKAGPPWTFGKVTHELDGGREFFLTVFNERDGDQEVAVLDGVWFAARRSVVMSCPFDAVTFPGFHFYDMDFCLQAGCLCKLVATTDIRVKHLSPGNFDHSWREAAQRFSEKWKAVLPMHKGPVASFPPPGSARFASIDLRGKAPQWILI